MRHVLLTASALALLASPAFAKAVTFQGTLGKLPIIFELSQIPEESNTTTYGRYAYLNKGIDIPLHVTKAKDGNLTIREEVACKTDGSNCPHAGDDDPSDPPLGATWTLNLSGDGRGLLGNWTDNGKTLPVEIVVAGVRDFTQTAGSSPADLTTLATSQLYNEDANYATIDESSDPYDFLKLSAKDNAAAPTKIGDYAYTYVTDPRTTFQFPRITGLGGADMTAANAYLSTRDYAMRADALNCSALVYQGFGWHDYDQYVAGTLGGYDDESTDVTYLSPTIMSWTESGSLDCGQAHPYNHHDFYNLDVRTGKPLDLSLIFKGWVPDGGELADARTHPADFVWKPDATLAAFVKQHRTSDKDLGLDTSDPDECKVDDFIDSNLSISFVAGDKVLFSLGTLEDAVQACTADLYEAPISELKPLLAPTAADYFPSLKN
jgi:hypothetical protein